MKSLSSVLENMPQCGPSAPQTSDNSSHTPPHGLIKSDGRMNQMPPRLSPLSPSQITSVQSMMDSAVSKLEPVMKATWKPLDYRKTGLDGKYEMERGEGYSVALREPSQEALTMARAALRLGVPDNIYAHLGKLAMHKKFNGMNTSAAMVLEDYTMHLAQFPEYAVVSVINHVSKTDEKPFFPQLATLIRLCREETEKLQAIHDALHDYLNPAPRIESPNTAETREQIQQRIIKEKQERRQRRWKTQPKTQGDENDWDYYILHAQSTADIFRNNGITDKADEWQALADERRKEKESK